MKTGALTLMVVGDKRRSSEVTYVYTTKNTGSVPTNVMSVIDDMIGLIGEDIMLEVDESMDVKMVATLLSRRLPTL